MLCGKSFSREQSTAIKAPPDGRHFEKKIYGTVQTLALSNKTICNLRQSRRLSLQSHRITFHILGIRYLNFIFWKCRAVIIDNIVILTVQ
jgi:hypothetical protein